MTDNTKGSTPKARLLARKFLGYEVKMSEADELEVQELATAFDAFAAQAVAAERTKQAASDLERASQAYGFVAMPDPVSLSPEQMAMIERIAAALAEARRAGEITMRERCAKVADKAASRWSVSTIARRAIGMAIRALPIEEKTP